MHRYEKRRKMYREINEQEWRNYDWKKIQKETKKTYIIFRELREKKNENLEKQLKETNKWLEIMEKNTKKKLIISELPTRSMIKY